MLSGLAIILILSLLILSCNKKASDIIYDRKQALPQMQESARTWYLQHREAKPTSVEYNMLTKYWAKAATLQTSDSDVILVVPLPDPPATLHNKDFTFKRFLVFQPQGNTIASGKVVELLGQKYNVGNNADYLLRSIAQNSIPGFNGSIMQYDVNYQPLENSRYENGTKKANTQTAIIKFSGRDRSPVRSGVAALPVYALKPGRYKIDGHIYTVKGMAPYKTLLIEDNDSLVADFIRHAAAHNNTLNVKPFSQETIGEIFKKVLGDGRLKELSASGKGNIIVTLYCAAKDGKGKVAAVQFLIFQPQENKLSLYEIDKISDYIKENIAFDIPSSPDNQNKIWPVAQAVNFSRLAN